jgi:hypothetical protein
MTDMKGAPMDVRSRHAAPEQLRYARVLGAGARISQVLLAVSFLLYLSGIREPLIAVDQLPRYWGLPLAQFVKATNAPTGWAWFALIGKSDMLNLLGLAVLAGVPAFSSLAVLPIFARRGEIGLFAITALQIVVLIVSASNILAAVR